MRMLMFLAAGLLAGACHSRTPDFKVGTWRGTIDMQNQQLPFTFDVAKSDSSYTVYLKNGSEKLMLDEIKFNGDSVRIVLHIFDAELRGRITDNHIEGYFVRNFERNYRLPFHATFGDDYRFARTSEKNEMDFSGKYAVRFFFEKDTSVSVGIFKQSGNHVEGTFLNTDGDYRYLEGSVIDSTLWLSTFDGHHLYIFSARKLGPDSLVGDYWSGKAHHETWKAERNDKAALPDMESLAFLKKGYDRLDFSFPDLNGKKISPSDAQFKNKVLIIQLFGTWCPNCMDETRFLSQWYKKNADRGVEILALAFERKDDFSYARERILKMKSKLDVDYNFVVAGTSDKKQASEALPALSRVYAFPTTIFIGKDGKVKHIHSGFSGPGTGVYYEQNIARFNETVNELLSEKLTSSSGK